LFVTSETPVGFVSVVFVKLLVMEKILFT